MTQFFISLSLNFLDKVGTSYLSCFWFDMINMDLSLLFSVKMSAPKEDFMTSKWRPMMAVTYMATIWFDFIIGPILYNVLQYWNPGQAIGMWQPLTLQGGGLIHIAFGAILGISAWTRGQEKVEAIKNPPPAPTMSANISTPADDEPPPRNSRMGD